MITTRVAISQGFEKKSIVFLRLLIALGWFFCVAGSARENSDLTKLAENVYARIVSPDGTAVSNSGIIVLDHSVLVFDTHFTPEAAQALLAGIRSVTSKPVRYVVNSHCHADHTHGNQAFPGAQIIGSTSARRDVLQIDLPSLNRTIGITKAQVVKLRQEMTKETDAAQMKLLREQIKSREDYLQTVSSLKIMAPFVTLDDSMTIREGRQEVRIAFLGTGHTDGDIVLYLPSSKIAFVGDLFFSEAIPNVQDASILQWMKTLEEVLKLDADKFVPGHGPVGSKKDVQGFLNYFEELKSAVQSALARNESVEQVTKDLQMPAKYSSYRFTNFFPSNIQKMYAELKALQISSTPKEGSSRKDAGRPQK